MEREYLCFATAVIVFVAESLPDARRTLAFARTLIWLCGAPQRVSAADTVPEVRLLFAQNII